MSKGNSSSFNHFCVKLPDQWTDRRCWAGGSRYIDGDIVMKCGGVACYSIGYEYVTGRQGRVTSSGKAACPLHAAKFCARHKLPEPTEHTSTRIIHDEQKLAIAKVGDRVGFSLTGAEVAVCKWIAFVHEWDLAAGEIVVSLHGIAKPHFRLRYDPTKIERLSSNDLGCFDGLAEIIEIKPAEVSA